MKTLKNNFREVPLKEYEKYVNYACHWLHLKLVKP